MTKHTFRKPEYPTKPGDVPAPIIEIREATFAESLLDDYRRFGFRVAMYNLVWVINDKLFG